MAINVHETSPVFLHGQTTAGAAAAALTIDNRVLYKGRTIKSAVANSDVVYVGNTAAQCTASLGFPLQPGDSLILAARDASDVFIFAPSGAPELHFIGN